MKTAYENSNELMEMQKASMAYDGKDFEIWKISAREKLSELLGMNKFTDVAPD